MSQMGREEVPAAASSQEDQNSALAGPSRRIVPIPSTQGNMAQYLLSMGMRGPERTPRPNIIQRHQDTVSSAQSSRAIPQNQHQTVTTSAEGSTRLLLDSQFRQMFPAAFNAQLLQQQQQAAFDGTRAVRSLSQGMRTIPSTSTLAGVQLPRPVANPNLIRPTHFRPRLPLTQEVFEGLLRGQGRTLPQHLPVSAPTTLKRQASPTSERPPTKRSVTNALKSIPWPSGVLWDEEQVTNFSCSLCFEQFTEPHITPCGHTFCLACIERFLLLNSKCPNCNGPVKRENVAPNRALHQLMRKQKEIEKGIVSEISTAVAEVTEERSSLEDLDVHAFLQKKYNDLTLGEVEVLMSMLERKKEILYSESEECRRTLVHDFLFELQQLKEAELNKIIEELSHINSDLATIAATPKSEPKPIPSATIGSDDHQKTDDTSLPSTSTVTKSIQSGSGVKDIYFNATDKELRNSQPSIAQRKVQIHSHFSTLANMYLKSCHGRAVVDEGGGGGGGKMKTSVSLENFTDALVRISRYNSFKLLATLSYKNDTLTNANIVSTIEFDKDKDFFAIAGVTKKIRVFEYGSVIAAAVTMQTANGEIACSSKISCIAYSRFYKNKLASSDYDGKVSIYDTATCEATASLNEHEKRVWSVDFSDADPRFLISGSDDCKVKLWSITQPNSVTTLQTNANVCCVKFVPGSTYTIACGSADHCVHYYDLRQPKTPLRTFDGHKKAVSYVQFASKTELVSASTDGNLKLWDLNGRDCVRSYVGHINDKNFVGLTTDGNYLACGSEDNSVYIYYKDIPSPLISYRFENYRSMINPARQDDVSCEFVSAVAWRTGSPVVVAANSQGIIKVLELI